MFDHAGECRDDLMCMKDREILKLKAENKEKQDFIDDILSQEPCPKCGFGITVLCYGCEIKKLQSSLDEKDDELIQERAYSQDLKKQLAGSRKCFGQLRAEVEAELNGKIAMGKIVDQQAEAIQRLKESLEKLARLGNEPELGTSDGNRIAQQAMKEVE